MSHKTQIKKFQNCSVWSHFLARNFSSPLPFRLMAKSSFGKFSPSEHNPWREPKTGKNWEVSVFIVGINKLQSIYLFCSKYVLCSNTITFIIWKKKPTLCTQAHVQLIQNVCGPNLYFGYWNDTKAALDKALWPSARVLKDSTKPAIQGITHSHIRQTQKCQRTKAALPYTSEITFFLNQLSQTSTICCQFNVQVLWNPFWDCTGNLSLGLKPQNHEHRGLSQPLSCSPVLAARAECASKSVGHMVNWGSHHWAC